MMSFIVSQYKYMQDYKYKLRVRVIVFNTTINNISVISRQSVLLVEETGVPGENHGPVASHWQILYNDIMMVRT